MLKYLKNCYLTHCNVYFYNIFLNILIFFILYKKLKLILVM